MHINTIKTTSFTNKIFYVICENFPHESNQPPKYDVVNATIRDQEKNHEKPLHDVIHFVIFNDGKHAVIFDTYC